MSKTEKITTVTLWANRLVGLAVVVLIFTLQALMDWYSNFRELTDTDKVIITVAFYICAVVIFAALWNIDGLLKRLLKGQVFTRENVACLRRIQWCCGIVSLVSFITCIAYLPLVFMAAVMIFVFLAIGVGVCVMDSAVAIREENDLTI